MYLHNFRGIFLTSNQNIRSNNMVCFMNEKSLRIARNSILLEVQMNYPNFQRERVDRIADQVLNAIDWDNPALMHKGIAWIVNNYFRKYKLV